MVEFRDHKACRDLSGKMTWLERRMDFGATIGWNPNVVGFEVDFGWSPNFFEDTAGDRNFEFGDSNVTTLMTNLLFSAPPGTGLRPYLSTGLGLIRANVDRDGLFNDLSTNDFGVNVGGVSLERALRERSKIPLRREVKIQRNAKRELRVIQHVANRFRNQVAR